MLENNLDALATFKLLLATRAKVGIGSILWRFDGEVQALVVRFFGA
uniref:Uncharacterized protein n=1 Tax=Candidozyma auris TaxID=498019 RepID=A0A0L0P3H3_CANAR